MDWLAIVLACGFGLFVGFIAGLFFSDAIIPDDLGEQ